MAGLVGVYGASGFGREVLPLVRAEIEKTAQGTKIVFIDDSCELQEINTCPVMKYEEFVSRPEKQKNVTVAIANSQVREKIFRKLRKDSIGLLDIKSNNAVIMDNVFLGAGYVLSPFVTITSDIQIGLGFHANLYSYVGHDCTIGDFVTFAPAVKCNGNVVIQNHAYIGTGAILKQGRPGKPLIIGEGAIVGMGAVVTKDVPSGATVIGNPAKPMRQMVRSKSNGR